MKVKFLKGHVVRDATGGRVVSYCAGDVAEVKQPLASALIGMEKVIEVKEVKKVEPKPKDV
jgi:hypothetical protein